MRVVWVLRENPFDEHTGQSRWTSSLIESSAGAGIDNQVLLPNGFGLPTISRRRSGAAQVHSRLSVEIGPLRLTAAPSGLRATAWKAYTRAPHAFQHRLAQARRRRRSRRAVDHVLGREMPAAERAWVAARLRSIHPDRIVFDSVFYLGAVETAARRLVLMHDIAHQRAASFAAIGYRTVPAGIDRNWESERIRHGADAAVCIQWDEADALRSMVPGLPVVVAPPTFARRDEESPPDSRSCLFVGNGTMHNVDGLSWFLAEIWPTVRRRTPDAVLRVAGAVGSQMSTDAPGVELVGIVGDLDAEYDRAAVVIVPLRAGSGLKVKLAEALAHGRAVVTTSVGAQGLSAIRPLPYIRADDPGPFADAVVRLLEDLPFRRQTEAAAGAAGARFDPATAHGDLLDLLRSPVGQ